ncbi:hypothetical protein TeGR_g6606, partial [Tetraparma gracilis]
MPDDTLSPPAAAADVPPLPNEPEKDEEEWSLVLACFVLYKEAFGDLKIPNRFAVPSLPPWPEEAWGLKLGLKVGLIRSTGKYTSGSPSRCAKLDELGFVWRMRAGPSSFAQDGIEPKQVLQALRTYRELYNDSDVPASFVVPDAEPWPVPTRWLPLGQKVTDMRAKSFLATYPEFEDELISLGFELDPKAAANAQRFSKVYDALAAFKRKFGHLDVSQTYVVSAQDKNFPESTWGLRLGARVNAIRTQGTFVKTSQARRDILDDLGFSWDVKGKKGDEVNPFAPTEPSSPNASPFNDNWELAPQSVPQWSRSQ